jgi:microcystin-dependent protein
MNRVIKYLKNMFGNDDPILGEIKLLPWEHEIEGYLICDGRTLEIEKHTALYSLLGTVYGGDDNNFNIPVLPAVKGMSYAICIDGRYPIRS